MAIKQIQIWEHSGATYGGKPGGPVTIASLRKEKGEKDAKHRRRDCPLHSMCIKILQAIPHIRES